MQILLLSQSVTFILTFLFVTKSQSLGNATEFLYKASSGAGHMLGLFLVLFECCIIGDFFKEMVSIGIFSFLCPGEI